MRQKSYIYGSVTFTRAKYRIFVSYVIHFNASATFLLLCIKIIVFKRVRIMRYIKSMLIYWVQAIK